MLVQAPTKERIGLVLKWSWCRLHVTKIFADSCINQFKNIYTLCVWQLLQNHLMGKRAGMDKKVFHFRAPGLSCSKLTTSLANEPSKSHAMQRTFTFYQLKFANVKCHKRTFRVSLNIFADEFQLIMLYLHQSSVYCLVFALRVVVH